MFVKMKFIVGVTLLVVQSSFLNAVDLDHESEEWQFDLDEPTETVTSTSLPLDVHITGENENSVIMTKDLKLTKDIDYPVNHKLTKLLRRMGGERKELNVKLSGGVSKKVDKIIYDIESQNFPGALKKIHRLNNVQGVMNNVIHKVYDNSAGNLGLILQFVDSNDNVTSSLAIYKALNYEMNNNNHNSHLLRLKLMKSFNNKVVIQNIESDNDLSKAKVLKTELDYLAGNSTADELKSALKMNDSESISTISENVYNNYPVLFDSAIRQVLNQAFDAINKPYLLEFFMNHKYASQSVYTYSNLFGQMRKRKQLNQPFLVNLAFALKKALGQEITDRYARETGFNLKIALPDSVRNIAFGDNLCIVNTYYHNRNLKEYLFAAGEEYDVGERRKVYTWVPGGSITNGYWVIEQHDDDTFFIKNRYYIRRERKFRTEYLYGAYIWRYGDPEERRVFTWIKGPPDDNQFNWMFVPNGNNVYIKNAHHNEYLYASEDKKGDDRREIFTKSTKEKGSLWTIENCKPKY